RGETSGTVRGGAPIWRTVFLGFGQSTPDALGVEVLGIDWCAGLLPPGLVQPSSIDAIKTKLINELEDDVLGRRVVARNRQSDALRSASRPTPLQEVPCVNVLER